jgi:xanthine dehydrogenase YagR molybdenum-binding subunit
VAARSAAAYVCPNVATRDEQRRLNIPAPASMRGPGEAQGNFALESAMDELAHALGTDPLELRLRNYAETHPQLGLPWSSKALRDCYEHGAERFGWSARNPRVGSMRDRDWLVGYGMAGVSYPWWQPPHCQARASIRGDGTAFVRSAATDIGTGTGTYTVMTQLSAELLGLGLDQVRFDLGDTDLPYSPQAGGSGLTAALSSAVHAACRQLVQAFLDTVAGDPGSPLRGCRPNQVTVADGRILNQKTARSQIIGGTVGGIGMALLEETVSDPGTGRIAIANAVYHATGRRIRSLPITIDQLL